MNDRLPTGLVVGALLRRANDAGGIGVVLARGDAQAGGLLVCIVDRAGATRVLERGVGPAGEPALIESNRSEDPQSYWQRRRGRDPDLWVIELDVPSAERFAAETML
ncbi:MULTISPECIES: DUF1491 family protein [unclassified Sphingomonas]|uniref:DUF1491 family protein n=1 Tax=unclassified Sphingomonas TaxID=196159 RepID=UPI00226AA062